jgi:hypothetical protein
MKLRLIVWGAVRHRALSDRLRLSIKAPQKFLELRRPLMVIADEDDIRGGTQQHCGALSLPSNSH